VLGLNLNFTKWNCSSRYCKNE